MRIPTPAVLVLVAWLLIVAGLIVGWATASAALS